MDELETSTPVPQPRGPGFWKRQFSQQITTGQRTFDVLFGVITPILALAFDPVVFKGSRTCVSPEALLGEFSVFAYTAIGLGTLCFLIWMIAGSSLTRL